MTDCARIGTERLVDWWCGEISGTELDTLEEHLLDCDTCARAAERLAMLADGLASIGDKEGLPPIITGETLDRLTATSTVEVYRARSGDAVHAKLTPESQVVVVRVEADLAGLDRLDVELRGADDHVYFELVDAPFSAGEVIIACRRHVALSNPEVRVRFLGVDAQGRREVARVTLHNHPPP